MALIFVEEFTINDAAKLSPKLTLVAPVKLVPVMLTVLPFAALTGVNEDIVGVRFEKMNPVLLALPPGVITLTLPVAPIPTTAEIKLDETTVYEEALMPPKLTAVVPVKLVPVIVTVCPTPAELGENEVIVGD
jgi:hypothetical protein